MKKNNTMKMKLFIPTLLLTALCVCSGSPVITDNTILNYEYSIASDTIINFKNCEAGKIPDGFTQTATGKPQHLNWQVVNDKGNKVVAQLAENEGDHYNILIIDKPTYQNFILTVRIKAVEGDEDQGGGLVWRYIDNNNYYIARCNPLENNFRFYRVVNGNRKQLKSIDCVIRKGVWFTLSVEMKGDNISCSLNSIKMIETTDDTFKAPGQIGMWTKADAVTYFDDLIIQSF